MKTIKLMLAILAVSIAVLPTAAASAHTSVGFGVGWHSGYRHGNYWGHGCRPYRHHRYYSSVVFVDPYWPPPVVVAPPVVVRPPVVVTPPLPPAPTVSQVNYDGLDKIRMKKVQLLDQLNSADRTQRLAAVIELAGFSFDEQVKAQLENILLSDPDPVMRIEAAIAFAKVKNTGALPTLEKARVNDSDLSVRQTADSAITQIKS